VSCKDDSDGPIFDREGKQIFVMSWGYGCAREDFPSVYSHVFSTKYSLDVTICELSSSHTCGGG
jgi:secreted trypsin-like serine protease